MVAGEDPPTTLVFMLCWELRHCSHLPFGLGKIQVSHGGPDHRANFNPRHLLHRVIPKSSRYFHWKVLQAVISAPFSFMSRIDTGTILNRFNQDMMLIDGTLPLDFFNTAAAIFTGLMQIALIIIASVYTIAVLPALFGILYLIQTYYLRTSKQLRQLDLEAKSPLHSQYMETFSGLATIRAFGWQPQLLQEHFRLLDISQEPFYLLYCVQRWLQLVLNLVIAGLIVVIMGAAVGLRDTINPGSIGVSFINASTLGETLTNLIISWTSLETSLGAISRTESFCQSTPTEPMPSVQREIPGSWPEHGAIQFRDVSASYDLEIDNATPALRNINLDIPNGQRIAVCGPTGSGKSSFLLAFFRMIRLTAGSIVVDDIDISHVSPFVLRSRLNVVPQDVYAFSGTMQENLDPTGGISDEKIVKVLQKCEVWAKVEELGGLHAEMETGAFSAGQGQLFCLARAILKASKYNGGLVVMDEATSRYVVGLDPLSCTRKCKEEGWLMLISVDMKTHQLMEKIIVEEFKTQTVLSVLHRLDAAAKYDKILVLGAGRLIDFGTPSEIIPRCDLFRSLRTR